MDIKKTENSGFKQLVADFKRIDKTASSVDLSGINQPALSNKAAVVSSARPDITIGDAELLTKQLQNTISEDSQQAIGAMGSLSKDKIDRLLEE